VGFGGVFLSFCLEGINGNRGEPGDNRGNRGQRTTDNVCRHNGAMQAIRGGEVPRYKEWDDQLSVLDWGRERGRRR